MNIQIDKKDREGNQLEIGDKVELFDWGDKYESLGVAELVWDNDDGRVSCDPQMNIDAYDFWTKAIPRCRKVSK